MVGNWLRAMRAERMCRWLGLPGLALVGSAAMSAPALAQNAPSTASPASTTIFVSGDSVLATSLPGFGQTTVTVTRPDAVTGTSVVIGTYSGSANPLTPFSVNTTTPGPLDPSGDCWQQGTLSEALTPDLQPGDTVTLTQAGMLGATASSFSTVVEPSDLSGATLGPISGCSSLAPWARNAISSAPSSVQSGNALTVSGVAQPLATAVSVNASDGTDTTSSASVTPAPDGTWTATIPASALASLGNTDLTVTPVLTVPDLVTGVQAHIAGIGARVEKAAPPAVAPVSEPSAAPSPTSSSVPVQATPAPRPRVTGLRVTVRGHGIQASFIVPTGAQVVKIRLLRGRTGFYTKYVAAHRPGARQTVALPIGLTKRIKPGRYELSVTVGLTRTTLGPASSRIFRITSHLVPKQSLMEEQSVMTTLWPSPNGGNAHRFDRISHA